MYYQLRSHSSCKATYCGSSYCLSSSILLTTLSSHTHLTQSSAAISAGTADYTSQCLPDEFPSVTSSEKIKLGKHPANTQAETTSSKRQRNLYTSDTLPVAWKPPTCASRFPHYPSPPSLTPQDTSSIPPPATVTTPPNIPPPVTHTLGMKMSEVSKLLCSSTLL